MTVSRSLNLFGELRDMKLDRSNLYSKFKVSNEFDK